MSNDPTWQEAITPTSQAEYVDLELAALEAAGSSLNGWSDDAPQRALVEGEATALAQESVLVAQIAKTASPTTVQNAGDSWVDATIGWFDIERIPATPAVWSVEMVLLSGSSITINATNAGSIQAMNSAGVIFLCTQASPVTINSASSFHGFLQFTAREAGVNITPSTIDFLISAPSGLAIRLPGEGGTQTLITAARTQESSADLIRRGLGRWGVIGPSTNSAQGSAGWTRTSLDFLIPFFAPTVTRWGIEDNNPVGPGTVRVTLANQSGPATTGEITAVTDGLNGLSVKPVGSGQLYVQAANNYAVSVTATLQSDGTVNTATTKAAIESALARLGSLFPINGKLTPSLVNEIMMGAAVQTASVETGTGDTQIGLFLPPVSGIEYIVTTNFTVDANLGTQDVLVLTPTITVLA